VASVGVEFQHLPAVTGDVRSGLFWGFTRLTFVSFRRRFGTYFPLIHWTRSLSRSATVTLPIRSAEYPRWTHISLYRGGGLKSHTGTGEKPRKCLRVTGALPDVRTSYILNAIQAPLFGTVRCVYPDKTWKVFRSQIFCSDIEIHGFTQSLQGQFWGKRSGLKRLKNSRLYKQHAVSLSTYVPRNAFTKIKKYFAIFRLDMFIQSTYFCGSLASDAYCRRTASSASYRPVSKCTRGGLLIWRRYLASRCRCRWSHGFIAPRPLYTGPLCPTVE
jgi:hypothetical protein